MTKSEPAFHTEATLFSQQCSLVSEACQVRRLFDLLSLNSQLGLKSWTPSRQMKEVVRGVMTLQLSASWPVKGSWMMRWIFSFWVCRVTRVTATKDWLPEHHSWPSPISPDWLSNQITSGHYFTAVMGNSVNQNATGNYHSKAEIALMILPYSLLNHLFFLVSMSNTGVYAYSIMILNCKVVSICSFDNLIFFFAQLPEYPPTTSPPSFSRSTGALSSSQYVTKPY